MKTTEVFKICKYLPKKNKRKNRNLANENNIKIILKGL